ncbi:hypothetical protein E1301_Tti013471 [Triplophysa tibetana]|uniref:Immunoglobulin domain-containing protein n=1 Tax=Triplophysa tibetana TaxID=1572043 RepID=A0A5A9NSI3_9TELE|nr:hypothetical protein E1301_Tti013471 [Triplophysa tibetana]
MKSIFVFVILVYGVFDALTDEVMVMEGDPVTLQTNLTELQANVKMYWWYGPESSSKPLVKIEGNQPPYPDFPDFNDRLHIDRKTGELTIRNMRPKHTGPYRALVDTADGKIRRQFKVTVFNVPRVLNPAADEVKSLSVKEGESVILQTDLTELHSLDLIVWRFGDEGILIAKDDKEDDKSPEYYDVLDKRFSGKIQMDDTTGDLTIRPTTTNHTGVYKVKISSNNRHKTFNVVVHAAEQGLSGGEKAGIVVGGVLLGIPVVIFGVAAVIWSRRRVSELKKRMVEILSVLQADDLILPRDHKDIQTVDEGEWIYGDKEIIAKFNKKKNTFSTYDDVMDERFKDKLNLNSQTGSLTIKNIKTRHSGLYTLKISSASGPSSFLYNVIVLARDKSVHLGGSVTLETGVTDIKTDDEIVWTIGPEDTRISRITGGTDEPSPYYYPDERFRDRLKMNNKTGDLTITHIRQEDIGVYEVQTYLDKKTKYKKFMINTPDSVRNKRKESPNDNGGNESPNDILLS